LLIGCAVLLMVVGCAGVRSQAPQKEEQAHAEATASEEARCSQTRTYKGKGYGVWTTNDLPGCPKGGLLSGTDSDDLLDGLQGEDEIHGLRGNDTILGGPSNDVIYGGPGDDAWLEGEDGEDVIYGGDGNDTLWGLANRERDKLYCGEGRDHYIADKNDYVDSCEKKIKSLPL
jgi:RTX calcium-binding nonapeptide repeat (4 copies)